MADITLLNPQDPRKYDLGEGVSLIDADTAQYIDDQGNEQSIRFAGANALETSKVDPNTGLISRGEHGGQLQHNLLAELGQGYNKAIVQPGEYTHGRQVGDLYSEEENRMLTNQALYHGVLDASTFSNAGQANLGALGQAERKLRQQEGMLNEWDVAAEMIQGYRKLAPFKAGEIAATAAEYAQDPDRYVTAGTQLKGRTMHNQAKDWFWDDLGHGGRSVANAFLGAADMITDFFSDDPTAIDHVLKSRAIHDSFGPNRDHLNPFDADGNWKLDSVGDYAKFFLGNFAVSAPYMGVILASSVIPGVGSYVIPSLMYSGEVYNEQADKNAGTAIMTGVGMSVLDRLGLDAIMGKYGPNLLKDKGTRNAVVGEIMKTKRVSRSAAEQMVSDGIRREMAAFSKSYKKILQGEMTIGNIVKNSATKIGVGSVGEAGTEVLQELLQSWGNQTLSSMSESELNQMMITAGLASAGIGGTLSTVGAATDTLGLYDAVRSANKAEAKRDANIAMQEADKRFQVETGYGAGLTARSKGQVLTDLDDMSAKAGVDQDLTLDDIKDNRRSGFRNIPNSLITYFKHRGITGAIGGNLDELAENFINRGGVMSGLFNGFLDSRNGNTGANGEQNTRIQADIINSETNDALQDQKRFGMGSKDISNIMYNEQNIAVWKRLAQIFDNPNNPYKDYKQAYQAEGLQVTPEAEAKLDLFFEKARELENLERTRARVADDGYHAGSFWDYTAYDPELIDRYQKQIAETLSGRINESTKDIQEMLDTLVLDEFDVDSVDFFDTTKKHTKQDTLRNKVKQALLADPEFAHLRTKNVHVNAHKIAHGAGVQNTQKNFYDKDGNRIARILKLAMEQGEITKEEMEFLAREFKDQFDIFNSEYHKVPRWWRVTQNFFMTWSTISFLPLATASSFPELGVALAGLTPAQQWKMFKELAKGMAVETGEYMTEIANTPVSATGYSRRIPYDKTKLFQGAAITQSLGYHETAQSAQARLQGGDDYGFSKWQRALMGGFFRATFMTNWTNGLRTMVAGSAADTIWGWIDAVQYIPDTAYGKEAAMQLAEMGIDVELLSVLPDGDAAIDALTSKGKYAKTDIELEIETQIRSAMINFIDGKVVMPNKTNRPKLYYDPRFKLFTHLTGYIATLTSVALPKIYKNVVRGTPGLSYGAFITIASMFMMGWMSQWLKDELKYGQPSPWLEDAELWQRALYASGLLGVVERPVDIAFPLYGSSSGGGILENFAAGVRDEAPVMSFIAGGYGAAKQLYEGNIQKGTANALKLTPLSPFYKQRQKIGRWTEDLFK